MFVHEWSPTAPGKTKCGHDPHIVKVRDGLTMVVRIKGAATCPFCAAAKLPQGKG